MSRRGEPPKDRSRCRECPLFDPSRDADGNDVTVPVYDSKQERVVKNGIPQLFRHRDGELVRWGMCGAERPRTAQVTTPTGPRPVPYVQETRSDWFCESPEKHAALALLKPR